MRVIYDTDPAEKYLGLDWGWRFNRVVEDGEITWVATIDEISDFRAFGDTKDEMSSNARDALLSHLRGYLVTGKSIPVPDKVTNATFRSNVAAVVGV